MHQTGCTGLVANLVQRKYRGDIPAYWKRQIEAAGKTPRAEAPWPSVAVG
jgi:hypothetical protein